MSLSILLNFAACLYFYLYRWLIFPADSLALLRYSERIYYFICLFMFNKGTEHCSIWEYQYLAFLSSKPSLRKTQTLQKQQGCHFSLPCPFPRYCTRWNGALFMQTHKYPVVHHFPALQWKHFRNVFYKEKVPSPSAPVSGEQRILSWPSSFSAAVCGKDWSWKNPLNLFLHACPPEATCTGKPVPVTTLWLVLTLSLPNEDLKLTAWVSGFKKQAWSSSCSSFQMLLRIPYRKPSSRPTADTQNHLLYHCPIQ